MPAGFQAFTAAGQEFATPDSRVMKFLGSVAVRSDTNPTGSLTNADFALMRKPDAWFIASSGYANSPVISFSGNTMSWSNPSGDFWVGRIIYGGW